MARGQMWEAQWLLILDEFNRALHDAKTGHDFP